MPDSYVEDSMRELLEKHVLEEFPAGDKIRAFMMKQPEETRMLSMMILFTPEGIVIKGDLCPRPGVCQGVISDFGYGIEWFGRRLTETYLCEKFMRHIWQKESAAEWCRDHAADVEAGEYDHEVSVVRNLSDVTKEHRQKLAARYKELANSVECDELMSMYDFGRELEELKYEMCDGIPGWDYPLVDAGWLCAIQQRFAELYVEMMKEKEPA